MVKRRPASSPSSFFAWAFAVGMIQAAGCGDEASPPDPATAEGPTTGPTTEVDPPSTPGAPDEVPEIRPGLLQGYLDHESLPDSLALLPAPPTEESVAFARDRAVAESVTAEGGRSDERFRLATSDADLSFPHAADTFACALGARITPEAAPHLYQLLRRSLTDAGLSTYGAKNEYERPRPFMANDHPTCTPDDEEELRGDGSYPSGHTAIGWAWALILAELAPERADAIFARGLAFGESRIICNVHWRSDVDQGRVVGAASVARLHGDEGFLRDLEAAKGELAALLAAPGAVGLACAAEAAALAANAAEEVSADAAEEAAE